MSDLTNKLTAQDGTKMKSTGRQGKMQKEKNETICSCQLNGNPLNIASNVIARLSPYLLIPLPQNLFKSFLT